MKKAHLLASALIVIVGLAGLVVFAQSPGAGNNINYLKDVIRFEKTSAGEETEPKDVLTATEYNKLVNTVADLTNGIGGLPDCSENEVLQYDGADWQCSGDTGSVPKLAPPGWADFIVCDGTGDTIENRVLHFGYVEPSGGKNYFQYEGTENIWVKFNEDGSMYYPKHVSGTCASSGYHSSVWRKIYLSDALDGGSDDGLPTCSNGEILQHDGTDWVCSGDTGSVPVLAPPGWPDIVLCNGNELDTSEGKSAFYFQRSGTSAVQYGLPGSRTFSVNRQTRLVESGKDMNKHCPALVGGQPFFGNDKVTHIYLSDTNVQVSGGSATSTGYCYRGSGTSVSSIPEGYRDFPITVAASFVESRNPVSIGNHSFCSPVFVTNSYSTVANWEKHVQRQADGSWNLSLEANSSAAAGMGGDAGASITCAMCID